MDRTGQSQKNVSGQNEYKWYIESIYPLEKNSNNFKMLHTLENNSFKIKFLLLILNLFPVCNTNVATTLGRLR